MRKYCGEGDIGGNCHKSEENQSLDRVCQFACKSPGFSNSTLARCTNLVQLASLLVSGTAIVLLQEPFLLKICLNFADRAAHTTRRIHALNNPIFFTLLYECILTISYWLHRNNSEEAEDTAVYVSSVLGQILGFKGEAVLGLLNLFGIRD